MNPSHSGVPSTSRQFPTTAAITSAVYTGTYCIYRNEGNKCHSTRVHSCRLCDVCWRMILLYVRSQPDLPSDLHFKPLYDFRPPKKKFKFE